MILQPFDPRDRAYASHITLLPERSPFTVDELVRRGVDQTDACMIVWPVSEEAFEEYARGRSR